MNAPKLGDTTSELAAALIGAPAKKPAAKRVVGMKSGETYAQAVARVDRQKAAIAKAERA